MPLAGRIPEPDAGTTYVCWHTFACDLPDGTQLTIRSGRRIKGDHPAVKLNPQFFVADGSSDEDVEARRRDVFPPDHPGNWTNLGPIEGR
jgi:hypothetical protein